jgi:hypothetical protein
MRVVDADLSGEQTDGSVSFPSCLNWPFLGTLFLYFCWDYIGLSEIFGIG